MTRDRAFLSATWVYSALLRPTSAAASNLRPLDGVGLADDLSESWMGRGVPVPPGDVAADHAGLLDVGRVIGAVQGEVAQRGEVNCASMRLSQLP